MGVSCLLPYDISSEEEPFSVQRASLDGSHIPHCARLGCLMQDVCTCSRGRGACRLRLSFAKLQFERALVHSKTDVSTSLS